ncbi:MAG: hypothetical protein CME88_10870 [Hirschia sp.]|nr:hypothetical protein [Hirschia sp.]MBF18869.1 hypothetical protein [Hirschia sp.]
MGCLEHSCAVWKEYLNTQYRVCACRSDNVADNSGTENHDHSARDRDTGYSICPAGNSDPTFTKETP